MSTGLPFKCSKHAIYTPDCRYCRNSAPPSAGGVTIIGEGKPNTDKPDIGGAYPSLAGLAPLYDRIIVVPVDGGDEHDIGEGRTLVIPETVRDSYPFGVGEVVAVGPGRVAHTTGELVPLLCEVGDVVVYDKKAGFELPWAGDVEAVCLREPEILGRFPKGARVS